MIDIAAGIDDSLVCTARLARFVTHVCRGDVDSGDDDLAEGDVLAERLRIPQHSLV